MRPIPILLLALLALAPLSAQTVTLNDDRNDRSAFGGFHVFATPIHQNPGVFAGGEFGWMIDHSIGIGLGGSALLNPVQGEPGPDTVGTISTGFGGLYARYVHDWASPVHFSAQMLLGAGSVSYHNGEWWDRNDGTRNWTVDDPTRDLYFVVEPALEMEANVGNEVRLALGAGYRFVSGVSIAGLSSSDLAGPSLRAAFRMGMF